MSGDTLDHSDDRLQELLLEEDRKGYRYKPAVREAAAKLTYAEAKDLLRKVLRFTDDTDYDAVFYSRR